MKNKMNPFNSALKNNDRYANLGLRLLLFVFIPLMFGLLSLYLGRDINWDLKNYHYYNAYAFLENRMDFDIAPAQLQTFINPIGDLPFYWLTKYFPSWVAGFVLGVIHGFNLSLVLLIFLKISSHANKWLKMFVGMCIVIVSGIAPGFISELGNTMNDNLTSLFVLGAIFMLLTAFELEFRRGTLGLFQIGLAGLVMGVGVGIKPSITIFAVSSALVFGVFQTTWKNRFVSLIVYGVMGLAGGLLSTGFWWRELWLRFGNPFFPFYNHIFKSPYFTSNAIMWSRFLPKYWWEYLAWPFIFSLDGYRVNQLYFSDIRFALLYIAAITWLVAYLVKKLGRVGLGYIKSNGSTFNIKYGNFLLLFFLFSYVLWIRESATYRFMISLELLVPLCFLIILERFVQSGKSKAILAVGAACLTFLFFKPFHWGRLDWDKSYFSVDTAQLNDSGDPIVIMLGLSPTSYVVPQFPPNYRFVRPEGNVFIDADGRPRSSNFLDDIENLLKQHNGNIYILFDKNEKNIQLEQSRENLDLDLTIEDCFMLILNTPDELEFCRLSDTQ